MSRESRKAMVVVLGELSRSPRMQYHCMSLANSDYQVSVIAYNGGPSQDKACSEIENNSKIHQLLMPPTPNFKEYLPSIPTLLIKPIWQSLILIYYLFLAVIPHVIIVQNPPSVPTLPIIYIYSRIVGAKLVIDWHNYGFSILALNLKPSHPIVSVQRWIEVLFGRLADSGFCVSEAMQRDLAQNFHIKYPIHVLYDKPPKRFKSFSLREKHNFYIKISETITEFKHKNEVAAPDPEIIETRFTISNNNVISPKPNRPAIIMSSTSWTEDEDFGLLLEALKQYDLLKANQTISINNNDDELNLPPLVCVITGKGPLKEFYRCKIEECHFKNIEVVLPWLEASDYPKIVACCDLGVSLHKSSSGVDLPMKVVDMFGCGVPVLAYHYDAIGELVLENFYGMTFRDPVELLSKMVALLGQFYKQDEIGFSDELLLSVYRKNIKRRFLLSRWEDNWNREARPVIDKLCRSTGAAGSGDTIKQKKTKD